MNLRIVAYVGLFGVIMGVATVLGAIRSGREMWFWLVIFIGSAYLIARIVPRRYFVHGLLAGLVCGSLATLIQAVFLDTYFSHNPEAEQSFSQLPVEPRIVVLVMTPIIGIISGLVLGVLSAIAGKIFAPKREAGAAA
jgi:hypothetical protein